MRASTRASGFFQELNQRGIRYCHFKSNARVAAGLAGATDLDLLFDGRQIEDLEAILGLHGFRRFAAHPSRRYPGVDDYFGLNDETGGLLHLQVHYRLIVGERFFKNYHLPWEHEFLGGRIRDETSGIFVADPVLEWLLLACRSALKIRWRDRIRARIVRYPGEYRSILGEHSWLADRADVAGVTDLARQLLGDHAAELVRLSLAEELRFRRLKRLRRELLRNPHVFRGYRPIAALALRWSRELRWIVGSANRRYLHRALAYSRSGSAGGVVVAVIGSDGAGKSSVAGALHSWLAGKIDVIPIYFGSGQGRSSTLRWPLKLALKLVRRRRSASPRLDPQARREREITLARAVWALVLAREKRAKLRLAVRARERGFIVVCDRYPQTQFGGVSDGPILWRWGTSESRLKRGMARWENSIYATAAELAPDLVVRLIVTPETAAARRPDDDPRELRFRSGLIKELRFETARHGVVDIDANHDLETVVLEVKRRLWPTI